jgi:ribosomal protein S18 acetylase RimI-like enzyme
MAIRKGQIEDIPKFESLDRLCFPDSVRYSRFDFLYYFFKKDVFTIVSENGRKIHAFLIADLKTSEVGHIISIDIHPSFRRAGLGTKLMAEAERIFNELGVKKIVLEVHEDNVIAQLFYSNLGYSRITG